METTPNYYAMAKVEEKCSSNIKCTEALRVGAILFSSCRQPNSKRDNTFLEYCQSSLLPRAKYAASFVISSPPLEVYTEVKTVMVMNRTKVYKWYREFKNSPTSVHVEQRSEKPSIVCPYV